MFHDEFTLATSNMANNHQSGAIKFEFFVDLFFIHFDLTQIKRNNLWTLCVSVYECEQCPMRYNICKFGQ